MKILHFIISIDKSFVGTTAYMELLSKELKNLIDLVVIAGITSNPLNLS